MIDRFLKFRPRATQQRTIDTLIGISKGMIADGVVNEHEAKALLSWLAVNQGTVGENPITDGLVERVKEMLADDILDEAESTELHDLLTQISGGVEDTGELFKPTTLPLDARRRRLSLMVGHSYSLALSISATAEHARPPCVNKAGLLKNLSTNAWIIL